MTSGVGAVPLGGMLGSPEFVGTTSVGEGAGCVMTDIVVKRTDAGVEAVSYPTEVEVASGPEAEIKVASEAEAEGEVDTGIGENGWVVNVTRFGVEAVPCAVEVSKTSVDALSVGPTTTVVVKRVVDLSSAEVAAGISDTVTVSVTVVIEHAVESAMDVGKSVISAADVEVAAAASVVVAVSLSDKLSPSGMLISGMSEASGVLVAVGRSVGVPVVVAVASVAATDVLESSSLSPSSLWSSCLSWKEPSPLIPPSTPVAPIWARASSLVVHEIVYTPNGELYILPHSRTETYSAGSSHLRQ